MSIKRYISLFVFLFFLAVGKSYACRPGTTCEDFIMWQGKKRTFSFYLPPSYAPNKYYFSLLIGLHGEGGDGKTFAKNITNEGFNKIANNANLIVVYPDALNGSWNSGQNGNVNDTDDVGFIRALIKHFTTKYHTNPFRVYAVGFSTGGMMTYRIACESADLISAIATISSAMPTNLAQTCKPSRHISVLMVNGTLDPILPWDNHQMLSVMGKIRGDRLSIIESFTTWLRINNIGTALSQKPAPHGEYDGTWAWVTFAKGFDDTEVMLYTIYKGGHTWPGGLQYLPIEYIGVTSKSVDATKIIWNFLLSHRLQPLPKLTLPNAATSMGGNASF